ncbi:MAG: pilin [Candidatus Pacebacteria bacterium]|nr:pilin [Candidatus Paceibacterota bacterium]
MKKTYLTIASLLILPFVTHAQDAQSFLKNFTKFLGDVFVPFLFGIAFLFFVYNAIRFFVMGGSNEEGREKAKALAIYGVAAFVLLITFWGIINLLSTSIGLDGCDAPKSDYFLQNFTGPTQPGNCP